MATELRNALIEQLLGPLHMHFLCARAAYGDYLANGRIFLFASSLRRVNESARKLLMQKGHLLPEQRQGDAVALVRHYDAWLILWDDLARRVTPALDEAFVFENSITYPKGAERALEQLYQELARTTVVSREKAELLAQELID